MLRKEVPVLSEPEVDTEAVRELFRVLLRRAERVMGALCARAASEVALSDELVALAPELKDPRLLDSWKTSGAAYGSAKIRSRPIYPRLQNDAGLRRLNGQPVKDLEVEEDVCGKYYSTYVAGLNVHSAKSGADLLNLSPFSYGKKASMTGGLFGFWCPHAICVGYHIMPTSEGRDDAFAGLFCHWEQAPTVSLSP